MERNGWKRKGASTSFGWERQQFHRSSQWRHLIAGASCGNPNNRPGVTVGKESEENRREDVASTGSGTAQPAIADEGVLKRQRVEAVLLLSRAPVASRKLAQLAGLADATEARTLVRQINQYYTESGRAFRAEEVAGGYQLMTRPVVAPWLRRLGHVPKTIQLTQPALETIAIVAYRQPVLKADIEAIRGVSCGEILRQLMERDLVRISGRSEELGRPYLYSTTKHFLQIFGLRGADALPALDVSEIEISDEPDWSDERESADPKPDPQPVVGNPEEESEMSTTLATLIEDELMCPEQNSTDLALQLGTAQPVVAIDDEDEDEDVYADDDEEDDFEDDEDEDWEDDDLEDEDDADWEEVEEDEDWEEEDVEEVDEVEEDDLDDADDDDDEADEVEEEEDDDDWDDEEDEDLDDDDEDEWD